MTVKSNLSYLPHIAGQDVENLLIKDASYGSSWKKRGGVGAFMMLARKWDRIENANKRRVVTTDDGDLENVDPHDIFGQLDIEGPDKEDGLLDDIRDLRRYLILVESEMIMRWVNQGRMEKPVRTLAVEDRHAMKGVEPKETGATQTNYNENIGDW
jgi:hypothetical protein